MQTQDLPYLALAEPDFSTRSPEVNQARDAHWCARTSYGLAVLRHRQAGLLLRDRRLRQGSHAWPVLNGLEGPFADFWRRSVISREGDAHRKLRNLAVPVLSEDFIAGMVPSFNEIADDLTAEMARTDTCEFMQHFAIPFAGQAICVLLGMDRSDERRISLDASDLGLAMGVECKRHEPVFNAAYLRLLDLARELVQRARGGRDETSYVAGLVARHGAMADVSETELLDMVVISIFGGVDTTRSQLGLGLSLFIDHPGQWQLLRARPERIPEAVEEMIMARPTTTWVTREAIESFEFDDVLIEAGTTLHLLVHASARDPAVCNDPAFDITAKRRKHFGFGGGAHHCIGHLMARTDIACALSALCRRFERFDYDGEPAWLPDSGNTSPVTLPIRYIIAN